MNEDFADISIRGKRLKVPAVRMGELTLTITGRWLKTATIKGETWTAGDIVGDPKQVVAQLQKRDSAVDIFTFSQKLPNVQLMYPYHAEWDNVAAIPITSFAEWWENRLSQVTRKNVRRAAKRGTVVKQVEFDDELLRGIVSINNETPYRDGRPFWHYGKDFETVKRDYSVYLDRSKFLGAYFENELIGFIRVLCLGDIASVMQLLCKNTHYDKRPANALLAKAVELCAENGLQYLVYGKYIYGDNIQSPLTEFKRRNGFEKFAVPSYYIPLTLKGRIAIKFGMHLGLRRLVPKPISRMARAFRRKLYDRKMETATDSKFEKEDG
jgi:hypothetical protein